jgi:hypothetical protein
MYPLALIWAHSASNEEILERKKLQNRDPVFFHSFVLRVRVLPFPLTLTGRLLQSRDLPAILQ